MAVAYLESSKVLCIALGDSTAPMTWPRASVVYFTSCHAVELFLKACIVKDVPTEKLHHDIERLQFRFRELHPTIKPLYTEWDERIGSMLKGLGMPRDAVLMKDVEDMPDQLYRYSAGLSGDIPLGVETFSPGVWIQWIERAEADLARIWSAIDARE